MPPRQRLNTTTLFSKLQQFLACSFALSYKLNPRNIEYDWYAYWNHVLLDVVKDTRNLVVCPQYAIWIAPDHPDASDDESEQASTSKSKSGLKSGQLTQLTGEARTRMQKRLLAQAQLDHMLANTGSEQTGMPPIKSKLPAPTPPVPIPSSLNDAIDAPPQNSLDGSIDTVRHKDASARITDFAILKIIEDHPVPDISNVDEEEHVEAIGLQVVAIIEIKRRPSRKLKGKKLTSGILWTIEEAIDAALAQAALLLHKYKGLDSVIAIAASGNYWRHAILRRNNVYHLATNLPIDLDYIEERTDAVWSAPYPLDSEPSWSRLQILFDEIRR